MAELQNDRELGKTPDTETSVFALSARDHASETSSSPILRVPDSKWLSRREAADLLTALGLKTSPATLATWFTRRSDGPPVQHFGRLAKYQAGPLREWAVSCLSKPRRSSSESREAA